MPRRFSRAGLGFVVAAAGLAISSAAQATWSMIIIDTRTGEVAVGSCTCLTGIDLQALTPILITGVGAAAAQSAGDTSQQNRTLIRDQMWQGTAPADILTALSTFDLSHQSRQYGIADVQGRSATFSGSEDGSWAGGQTGSFQYTYAGQTGTIVYAVQGNVLTGEPVVQMAVDALHNTAGDLPARFMAAMEAARSMGGDGRCSCPGGVTSCGSPPPTFTKSAHIGYMLIARAGDKDGSAGVYRAGPGPVSVAAADANTDGRIDVISANRGASSVSFLINATPPGSPFAMFAPASNVAVGAFPVFVSLTDMNGDSIRDLVTANTTSISVTPGLGGLAFGTHVDTPIAALPTGMVISTFDAVAGLDVSCVLNNSTQATLLNDGTGHLAAPLTRTAGTGPTSIIAVDVDQNGTMDVAVTSAATARLLIQRGQGNGTFLAASAIVTPPSPTAVGTGDFNHDGHPDLVCANGGVSPSVTIYFNNGVGSFSLAQTIPLSPTNLVPNDLAVCDLNGDSNPDVIISTAASSFVSLIGSPTGSFTLGGVTGVGFPITHITAADFTGDGRADAAYAIASQNEVGITNNRGDGTFQPEAGTAGGNYFLTLNVPNSQAGDVDPVIQLHSQFDAWRTALTGHPDAVQSLVIIPPLNNHGTSAGTMTVQLRDWSGQPITLPISSLTATLAPGGSGSVTIGAINNTGPGQYTIALTSGSVSGTDHLVITANDGVRKVVLMPQPLVSVTRCRVDFNGDGDIGTDSDIEAFFACLGGDCCAECESMDYNGDGDIGTDSDIEQFFIDLSTGGACP